MIRRLLLPVLLLTLSASAEAARPNIILIMADDVGYECFGCYGSTQYQTPHLDRLAREGLRFNHCYSQPLCTPSRVKIMTGQSNVRNYAAFSILRRDQKTFAHCLQEAGYRTVVGGKWQLLGAEHYSRQFRGKGTRPEDAGFDRHCLWQVESLGDRYWKPRLTIDGRTQDFGDDRYGPDIVTDYLLDFMTEHAEDDAPMFVYYPMILVHNPFLPTPRSSSKKNRNRQQNFEDMVEYMDTLVGRIAEHTRKLGIAENTLILFTADNGTNRAITSTFRGRQIRGGKGKTDDSGTREPLIAWWPGTVPAGRVSDQLVDFTDFLPTFQQLAGAPVPENLDGISFAPTLTGQEGPSRKWLYCFYHPRPERGEARRFVRDHEWKLYGDGSFFHVASDSGETSPQSPAAAPDVHARLKQALDSMPATGQSLLQFE